MLFACMIDLQKPVERALSMKAEGKPQSFCYRIVRKRVKNINLHITQDGEVWVSAPRNVSTKTIDAFVNQKADWIAKARSKITQHAGLSFFDGRKVLLFGEYVPVIATAGSVTRAELKNGSLAVTLPNPEDAESVAKVVDDWLYTYSGEVFERFGESVFAMFASLYKPKPQLRARRMKARWGSCHPQKGLILLSHRLVCAPPECIQYVLAHEFAHLVHPNHSPAFYSLLSDVMPDHKSRRALLSQYSGVMR